MTSQLGDILSHRPYNEPPEIKQIKDFVQEVIGITPAVAMKPDSIIVSVPNAAAAGALRFHIFKLQQQLGHKRRIILRIG